MRHPMFALLAVSAAWPALAAAQPEPRLNAEATLAELSFVLGRSHYLVTLCQGPAAQDRRLTMQDILDFEAPKPGPERQALAARFNDGYRWEQERWQICTAATQQEIRQLDARGKRLTRALAAHYQER